MLSVCKTLVHVQTIVIFLEFIIIKMLILVIQIIIQLTTPLLGLAYDGDMGKDFMIFAHCVFGTYCMRYCLFCVTSNKEELSQSNNEKREANAKKSE